MVMPRFSELEKQGLQIRDVKNLSSSCGNSMLFGTPQHVEDSIYLKSIMKGLLDDTVILIKNGLDFGLDTINVIIKDTTKTIPHNRAELGAISTRNQEARLFFFDFSKARPYDECKMKLLNATGEVDSAAIREHAEYSVNRAYSALKKSIKDDEVDKILELKKEFPSHLHYDHWYKLDSAIDVSFEAIKKDLVEDVAVRATKEIQQLAHEERIAQFRTTTGVQLEKNITSVVNNVIHNASTQGEKITEKSNGKMKWVVGGIVAATATIGADIAWKKKSHVGQEDERRQFSAGQQIRTI